MTDQRPPNEDELALARSILERAALLDPQSAAYIELENVVARMRKTAKKRRSAMRRKAAAARDAAAAERCGIVADRTGGSGVEETSAGGLSVHRERACYVCMRPYRELHPYYHRLCRTCGDASMDARALRVDLTGRHALVTGGRIKVGYATALRMLRDGAHVTITTRFPQDALRRYRDEPDAAEWQGRLTIHGCDFRDLRALLALLQILKRGEPFDTIINNAAQTIWHPPAYYRELWAGEADAAGVLPAVDERTEALLTRVESLFPAGARDAFGEPLDLRRENSWVQSLGEVPIGEFLEAQVVNAIAPYLICSELLGRMRASAFEERFVIQVAAAEGQFARTDKLARHPHTNMAKAALNMLTATSAEELAAEGIYMVSVDPGWVSHEGPRSGSKQDERMRRIGTPLAMEDAAARLYQPIASAILGRPLYGVLLKDFREVPW